MSAKAKLSDFSVIYWGYLLNRIDFRVEIGHHAEAIGEIIIRQAKYLISLYILGSSLD